MGLYKDHVYKCLNSENENNAMLDEKFAYEILIHSKSLILAIGLYFRAVE